MKHFLTAASFALLACTGLAGQLFAGSFGLFYAGRHCSQGAVCVRPYNAFTPVVCGEVPGCCYGGGGCGYGGCDMGCGGWGGCDPGYTMRGGLAPIGAPCAGAYCGALNYCPQDGYGLGAFGPNCCGRMRLFGMPVMGGCCGKGCGNWIGGACGYGYGNGWDMGCDYGCGYGQGYDHAQPSYAPAPTYSPAPGPISTPIPGPSHTIPSPGFQPNPTPLPGTAPVPDPNPSLKPILPNPTEKQNPPQKLPNQKSIAMTVPGSATPATLQTQPVSYFPGYQMPGQPMWGYPAAGYGYPMMPAYPYAGYYGW